MKGMSIMQRHLEPHGKRGASISDLRILYLKSRKTPENFAIEHGLSADEMLSIMTYQRKNR